MSAKKVNYLNNKDILKEIHSSKMSYCYIEDPEKHHQFDIILESGPQDIWNVVDEAKANRASRMQSEKYAEAMKSFDSTNQRNKPKQKDFGQFTGCGISNGVIVEAQVVLNILE